jgi:hypothetical protein
MRIAAFYELHYPFERECGFGGEHEMNVVRHYDELVEPEESAITITQRRFQKSFAPCSERKIGFRSAVTLVTKNVRSEKLSMAQRLKPRSFQTFACG